MYSETSRGAESVVDSGKPVREAPIATDSLTQEAIAKIDKHD